MKNKLYIISTVLSIIFLLEVLSIYIWANSKKVALKNEYELKIKVKQLNQEQERKKLSDEFEKNKYLASGKNVHERIYNKQKNDITDLLEELSKESFPNGWKCEVKVEEFTNFILLVRCGGSVDEPTAQEVVKYLISIVTYGSPYLKNVAIFDKKHKCYLFFGEEALKELTVTKTLMGATIADIKNKGKMFTRYNSIKIDFEQMNGHILVPAILYGDKVYKCVMMLDTGASMTVISLELAQKTGREDLNTVEKRKFCTAKGEMSCPVVERKISVGSIDKKQLVAVNLEDDTNLLGVDFLEDKGYIIDATSNCMYVWSK